MSSKSYIWVIILLLAVGWYFMPNNENAFNASAVMMGLTCVIMSWILYQNIKNNRALFTYENFVKSAGTMGLLAISLMAIIYFAVICLK